MNIRKPFYLAVALVTSSGLGIAEHAQAGEAYSYSFDRLKELSTVFTCSGSGVGCPGSFSFSAYQSSSSADANVDNNNSSGVAAGQVHNAIIDGGNITGFSPALTGGHPDSLPTFQEIGGVPGKGDNDFSAIGMTPASGTDYARGDAEIVSEQVAGDLFTEAASVAEGWASTVNGAIANGFNSSTSGLAIDFSAQENWSVDISFIAAPFIEAFIEQGGGATGDIDVSFTIRNTDTGNIVFNWAPNGVNIPASHTGVATETDDASLNVEIADTLADGLSETYDPIGNGTCSVEGCNYAASSDQFPGGSYSLILTMHTGIFVTSTPIADLEIEKTPDASDDVVYFPGETATFQIKVTNNGPDTAHGVTIDDDLPTEVNGGGSLVWAVVEEIPNLGACTIDINTQHLHCDVGELAPGAMFTVKVATTLPVSLTLASLTGTDFNATDGNLLLDNSEIPDGVGAPDNDIKDWESFETSIDCDNNIGCVFDTPSGNTDNSYTQGAKEDHRNPAISFGSIPPSKDDLLRWYFVQEFINSDAYLYLAWVRSNERGTATIDFELNQSGDLEPNGVNPVRTAGDVLIVYDFRGGRVDRLDLLRWLDSTTPGATDDECEASNGSVADGCWGRLEDLLASGDAEGAVNFYDNGTNKPGDDGYPVYDPIVNETITQQRFGEAAINLTEALGLPEDECILFTQAFVKSRASSSFTSELKDYIAPVPVDISTCVPIPNTAFADAENAPEVSDDGGFLVLP